MKKILVVLSLTTLMTSAYAGKASQKVWIEPSSTITLGDQQAKVCVSGFSNVSHVRVADAFVENGQYSSKGFTGNLLLTLDSSGAGCAYIFDKTGIALDAGPSRLLTITSTARNYKYGPTIDISVVP